MLLLDHLQQATVGPGCHESLHTHSGGSSAQAVHRQHSHCSDEDPEDGRPTTHRKVEQTRCTEPLIKASNRRTILACEMHGVQICHHMQRVYSVQCPVAMCGNRVLVKYTSMHVQGMMLQYVHMHSGWNCRSRQGPSLHFFFFLWISTNEIGLRSRGRAMQRAGRWWGCWCTLQQMVLRWGPQASAPLPPFPSSWQLPWCCTRSQLCPWLFLRK